VTDIRGQPYDLGSRRGGVTLIVNVASACGYTESNYVGIQRAYERYHDYGLEVSATASA
jgi:glutathione peroxidase